MLLDREAEGRLSSIIRAVGSSYNVYMTGRDLGQSIPQALSTAGRLTTASRLTFLETAYLAGKAARAAGTDALRTMSEEQLVTWLRGANVQITDADRAILNQMKNSTERWMTGRIETWQGKLRAAVNRADLQWRATLATTSFQDAHALATARSTALQSLVARIRDNSSDWVGDVDRLIQSEMNNYFQTGQTAGVPGDEIVYKVPRASACPHCFRVTTQRDGAPRRYLLKDVLKNSNVGLPSSQWMFTIGPIHPYCYCILYYEVDKPGQPNKELAQARRDSLKKSLEGKPNGCHIPNDPDLLFEEQKGGEHEPRPQHVTAMINAVKAVYGDRLPGS